jgi:hypothetical protein
LRSDSLITFSNREVEKISNRSSLKKDDYGGKKTKHHEKFQDSDIFFEKKDKKCLSKKSNRSQGFGKYFK